MSLEKEKNYSKKQEQLSPTVKIDTKNLLNKLAKEIAQKYGLDINQVKEFIRGKTSSKLEGLKSMVGSSGETIDLSEFKNVIAGAKDVIEKVSKQEIELLKGTLEKNDFQPTKDIYLSDKFIPNSFMDRAQNPQNIGDNLIGAGIGILNSTEQIITTLYNIGAGIIKTPYHVYLIVSQKSDYDGFKNI